MADGAAGWHKISHLVSSQRMFICAGLATRLTLKGALVKCAMRKPASAGAHIRASRTGGSRTPCSFWFSAFKLLDYGDGRVFTQDAPRPKCDTASSLFVVA